MLESVEPRRRRHLVGLVVAACLAGCGVSGSYVWVDDLPPARTTTDSRYVVGVGDLLNIHVWDHDGLSTRARVRSDGRISMPFLDDVAVSGKTPVELARELEGELKRRSLVVAPSVYVSLEEIKSLSVSVLGEVAKSGIYTLDPGAGVAEALASAGGLTEFAHRDRIFVLRRTPQPVRIRFEFAALTEAGRPAALFKLQAGDVVVAQ